MKDNSKNQENAANSVGVETVVRRDVKYKTRCHFSKTTWAYANKDGGCTCDPCDEPKSINEVWPSDRELFAEEFFSA